MTPNQSRRLWLTLGGGVVVIAVALAAALVIQLLGPRAAAPPAASVGGLVVQAQSDQDAKLDPQKPLRCFVNGQLVGEKTLAECAQQNGVATEALDVGVDQTGQLAANNQPQSAVTPLPPPDGQTSSDDQPAVGPPVGDCLRYAAASWREAGAGMSLTGCVKLLFDGHCQRPGGAAYGRWQTQTLRQVPGEIDVSPDNKDFHQLVAQAAPDCTIADF